MKFKIGLMMAVGCYGLSAVALGDVLELKNGTILNGTYAGGTAGTVRFTTDTGTQVVETSQIMALTFTPAKAATAAPAAAPVAAAQRQTITVPAGTVLLVRTMDPISSKNKPGTTFATKLETDVSAGNVVALKGGTTIYGRVQSSTEARRAVGRSTLDLRLTQMVVNGQTVPIMTSGYQEAGQRSGAKAAKGAAAGAAIGGIAGSAGKGAAIGAASGAVLRGQTLTITPGTLLEFTLLQPVTLPSAP